jgi:hypothetical protein
MTGGLGDVLGPVQVLLIGLDEPGSERMLAAELQDLQSQEAVRALDVLRVRRDPDGGLRRLDPPDPEEFPGTVVEALLVSDRDDEAMAEGTWSLADRLPRRGGGDHPARAPLGDPAARSGGRGGGGGLRRRLGPPARLRRRPPRRWLVRPVTHSYLGQMCRCQGGPDGLGFS